MRVIRSRFRLSDILGPVTLCVIVFFAAGFLLRDDLFIFGDHPGHYWRMWFTLNIAWPLHHRLFDWIPYWYAGFPEMQFYPPGFVLLGWLLHQLTFGALTTAMIYQTVMFASYALPGFTFYYSVRHLGFGHRAAFSAGLFGLIFPAVFGGTDAPFIGMVGSRLAFGLNALVFVWAVDLLEGRSRKYLWLTIGALAAVILAHTYHAVGILITIGLYIIVKRLPLLRASGLLVSVVLGAFALTAFWLIPYLSYSSSAQVPIIHATIDQVWRHLTEEILWPYVLLALPALVRIRRESDAGRRAMLMLWGITPLVLGAVVLFVRIVIVEQLGIYQLDPVRLLGEYYLPIILLAAVGLSELDRWIARALRLGVVPGIGARAATILVGGTLLASFFQAHAHFYPKEKGEPRFLSDASTDYRLDELWQALRSGAGRIMYTSHYANLNQYEPEGLNTTLPALTPLFTSRHIMGGTFSHWSPIAAIMWTGQLNPAALEGRVEEYDDRNLLGVPIEVCSADDLLAFARLYNVTTIIASQNDYQTRIFLDRSPNFQSFYNNGFFYAYRVKGYEAAWVEPQDAKLELVDFQDDAIGLRVLSAGENASVTVKVFAYPLWHAVTDGGQELAIARDKAGLMDVKLPRGEGYEVRLMYQEGTAERPGSRQARRVERAHPK